MSPIPPPGPARLEEGDDLPVDVGVPLDKDQVPGIFEDAQPGAGYRLGKRYGVGSRHVLVLRAVDHERRRGYAPHVARDVESGTSPHLLVVGRQGRRVRQAPAHYLLELFRSFGAIRVRRGRLETLPDRLFRVEGGKPDHVGQRPGRHGLGTPTTVARAYQHQPVYEVGPLQRQLLSHEAAQRGAEDVGLLYAQVPEQRHHVGDEVGDPTSQVPLPPDVEGDGLEVAREGRNLPEPRPAPEAQPPDQEQGRSFAMDVVVYAGVIGDHYRHVATSRSYSATLWASSLFALSAFSRLSSRIRRKNSASSSSLDVSARLASASYLSAFSNAIVYSASFT